MGEGLWGAYLAYGRTSPVSGFRTARAPFYVSSSCPSLRSSTFLAVLLLSGSAGAATSLALLPPASIPVDLTSVAALPGVAPMAMALAGIAAALLVQRSSSGDAARAAADITAAPPSTLDQDLASFARGRKERGGSSATVQPREDVGVPGSSSSGVSSGRDGGHTPRPNAPATVLGVTAQGWVNKDVILGLHAAGSLSLALLAQAAVPEETGAGLAGLLLPLLVGATSGKSSDAHTSGPPL